MKSYQTQIGGRTVLVSRDDGCSTDVGFPPCAAPVVAFVVAPIPQPAADANPHLRGGLAFVPKCHEHLTELTKTDEQFVYVLLEDVSL